MSQSSPSLVGSVVERSASSKPFKIASSASSSGFPSVQHRSKSVFARAREAKRNGMQDADKPRAREVPVVERSGSPLPGRIVEREGDGEDRSRSTERFRSTDESYRLKKSSLVGDEERWKAKMSQDNEQAIEAMTEVERERHQAEIIEQLGPNVGELLWKAREARAGKHAEKDVFRTQSEGTDVNNEQGKKRHREDDELLQPAPSRPQTHNRLSSPPRGILVSNTPPGSRSSTPGKSARKLRFANVTPDDVHVFQSEPSSPRRPIGLLPPPSAASNDEGVAKIELIEDIRRNHSRTLLARPPSSKIEPEEGTPEDIRRRFFPHLSPNDPSLEWIEVDDVPDQERDTDSEPRFDLAGAPISLEQRASLPTHLGLHHHGGSSAAGYTLADLLLLARSSVPAQRATVLGVLAKLVRRLARREPEVAEVRDHESVRSRALAAGLAALGEKGSLGVQAVDLVWTCAVFWDEEATKDLEGVELRPSTSRTGPTDEEVESEGALPSSDPLSSLPLPALLPQISSHFDVLNLPSESQSQLLAILYRLARHSIAIATAISGTPQLVGNVVRTFLLTPIPPAEGGPLPDLLALRLLRTLVLSSRANARTLEGPADALLRFVTTATPLLASPFPRPLAEALLCGTLELYAALARYGVYAGVATTAAEHFGRLSAHVMEEAEEIDQLRSTWLRLLGIWMVCACDPHRTTPTHDLLWSQVAGWTWGEDLLFFRKSLLSKEAVADVSVWGSLWGTLAIWLEGCRVNSAKAGKVECDAVSTAITEAWSVGPSGGAEKAAINGIIASLKKELSSPSTGDSMCTDQQKLAYLRKMAELSQSVCDFTRLCLACAQNRTSESPNGDALTSKSASFVTLPWVHDTFSLLSSLARDLVSHRIWEQIRRETGDTRDEFSARIWCLHLRPVSAFLASCVRLSRVLSTGDDWLAFGVAVLEKLLPGDEECALWLVYEIVKHESAQIKCGGKLSLLAPFFKYLIRPDEEVFLSPLSATPESIQKSTTQYVPADYLPSTVSRQARFGLPLTRDWPCVVLDHLLRSGTSPVLTNPGSVPDSWNASETELVQASLSLLNQLQGRLRVGPFQDFVSSLEHTAFVCMKVFMLEHNQQQSDSNEEVFRDTLVGQLMDDLLRPFSYGESRRLSRLFANSHSLEAVSKGFLGAGTPFYQFYTDFVALYDAISFSHRTFALLLLPPTSNLYALDYRKYLWGDFGHVLRTIQTPIEDVLAHNLDPYLWPFEADAEMVGWYLRALIKWPVSGFVHFLAVHHVACSIWPDLQEGSGPMREKRSRMLLLAVVSQAPIGVVRDVVCYTQCRGSEVRLPPDCFRCDEERKVARLTYVEEWGGAQIMENLEKIFAEIQ